MADWQKPETSDNYPGHFASIRDKDTSLVKMLDGTSDTNLPTGAKRKNSGQKYRLEEWGGSSWNMVEPGLGDLTQAEVDQLATIGSTTINATQWGWLGGLGSAPLEDNDLAANGGTVPETDRKNTFSELNRLNGGAEFTGDGPFDLADKYGANGIAIAGGFQSPLSGALYIGDDTGWVFRMYSRTGGSSIRLIHFKDDGSMWSEGASGESKGPKTFNFNEIFENGRRVGPIETAVVELGGDFDTGEEVYCRRDGDRVTITATSALTHSDTSTPQSSSGAIPSAFRPSTGVFNVNTASSAGPREVSVTSSGTFSTQGRNWDGTLRSSTNSGVTSITYLIT